MSQLWDWFVACLVLSSSPSEQAMLSPLQAGHLLAPAVLGHWAVGVAFPPPALRGGRRRLPCSRVSPLVGPEICPQSS